MNKSYTSKTVRQNPLLLRNDYKTSGRWGMPIISKCEVDISRLSLIGADKIKITDQSSNLFKSVHFFIDDNKLDRYYNVPERYLARLAQYPHILTPDFSLYTDMSPAIQMHNTFKSRWCGAYWQEYNLSVIPTVSWSTERSFEFCFDGLEYGTVVAISTLGALTDKEFFLKGYFEMKKRINPPQVLCFGKTFPEMGNEVVAVDYLVTMGRAS